MPRILYCLPSAHAVTGGAKMLFRHVEALAAMGYDAAVRMPPAGKAPAWFDHQTPILRDDARPEPDAILVLAEDDAGGLAAFASAPNPKVVFCQNPYFAAAVFARIPRPIAVRYRVFMACSSGVAQWIARNLDHDIIASVPGFADPAIFASTVKERRIAVFPRKRPLEFRAIQGLFGRHHPGAAAWRWDVIERQTERQAATTLARASVFLSLARLEGMSLTIIEALASGCLAAGFTGIGPREYTTDANGHWVDEDDCEAAAHALSRACSLAEAEGPAEHPMREAARATAAQWDRAHFLAALDAFWGGTMGLAPGPRPEALSKSGGRG